MGYNIFVETGNTIMLCILNCFTDCGLHERHFQQYFSLSWRSVFCCWRKPECNEKTLLTYLLKRDRRVHDRMVVGFTTTYASSAYHHRSCELVSRSCKAYSIQHYMIKFASDMIYTVVKVLQHLCSLKIINISKINKYVVCN
jgi:hypothetical protein